jgi:hypothetical protein
MPTQGLGGLARASLTARPETMQDKTEFATSCILVVRGLSRALRTARCVDSVYFRPTFSREMTQERSNKK